MKTCQRIGILMIVLFVPLSGTAGNPADAVQRSEASTQPEVTEVRTGEFELRYSVADVIGQRSAHAVSGIISSDEAVSWEVFVPESYDPESPAGLLVYVSPTHSGIIPYQWQRVLEARNLIWVSANNSGNPVNVQRRALFAVIAPTLMKRDYAIDTNRVYISGLSGGGKMASMIAIDHAHIFKGAIYNCGVEFWDDHPPRRFDAVKENRYVFVTGEHDQALRPTKRVYGRYKKAHVPNIKLMVIPAMGHENPDSAEFSEAIEFLDG